MPSGTNKISPATTDMIAASKTAPAAASFASFARGFLSSVTRSTTASTAVFTSSSAITSPNKQKQIHHFHAAICKIVPARTTRIITQQWIFMFLSLLMTAAIPSQAYLKLLCRGSFFFFCISRLLMLCHFSEIPDMIKQGCDRILLFVFYHSPV